MFRGDLTLLPDDSIRIRKPSTELRDFVNNDQWNWHLITKTRKWNKFAEYKRHFIKSKCSLKFQNLRFFSMLGYIQNATQYCPTPFLGSFNYSLNDGSSTFCDGTSMWDVCTDRTQMVVNYTLCSTKQFYSSRSSFIFYLGKSLIHNP